jgi:hypothetical protein
MGRTRVARMDGGRLCAERLKLFDQCLSLRQSGPREKRLSAFTPGAFY